MEVDQPAYCYHTLVNRSFADWTSAMSAARLLNPEMSPSMIARRSSVSAYRTGCFVGRQVQSVSIGNVRGNLELRQLQFI